MNTKHIVRDHERYAWQINKRIGVVLGYVEKVFNDFAQADEVPDNGVFRAAMNALFAAETTPVTHSPKKSLILETMDAICDKFIE